MNTPHIPESVHSRLDDVIKHWLLDIAVENPCRLDLILPSVEDEALNAKKVPGAVPESYAEALIELFSQGLVRISSRVPGDDVQTTAGVTRVLDRFLQLADDSSIFKDGRYLRPHERREVETYFALSHEGGIAWEGVAQPRWNEYFYKSNGPDECELRSQNPCLLMAIMGWFQETDEAAVDLASIRLECHSDFPIVYWKRIPFVYQANFSFEPSQPRWSGTGPSWLREPAWFTDWWSSSRKWHRFPWDLPSWPS